MRAGTNTTRHVRPTRRRIVALVLAACLHGCHTAETEPRRLRQPTLDELIAEARGRGEHKVADFLATCPTETERSLHQPTFDESLAKARDHEVLTEQHVADILAARRSLWRRAEEIPADYLGYVGATVEGRLVYAPTVGAIVVALKKANPAGRLGYFCYVTPVSDSVAGR